MVEAAAAAAAAAVVVVVVVAVAAVVVVVGSYFLVHLRNKTVNINNIIISVSEFFKILYGLLIKIIYIRTYQYLKKFTNN